MGLNAIQSVLEECASKDKGTGRLEYEMLLKFTCAKNKMSLHALKQTGFAISLIKQRSFEQDLISFYNSEKSNEDISFLLYNNLYQR